MTLEELKKTVRDNIGKARTKEAIEAIVTWAHANNQKHLKNDIILLKGDWTDLGRDKMLGLTSSSGANTRQNTLNFRILSLLDTIEEEDDAIEEEDNTTINKDNNVVQKKKNEPDPIIENPVSGKINILMLTANPAGTTKLNLDKEHSGIVQKLQGKQDRFVMNVRKAVNKSEFKEFPETMKPDILHFSGHGEEGSAGGLVVQNDDKNGEAMIPPKGLESLFKHFKRKNIHIKVVVLNACYSKDQAMAIANQVPYVIGTTVSIEDGLAISFSTGFYFDLAEFGLDFIEQAFSSGVAQAALDGAEESDFVIYKNGQKLEI